MLTIRNPVLPGFHPDPSFLRVGRDYYLATSTFEWFPGVRLHHSRDLVHWRCVGHALTDARHLDLRAVPNSGGIWAPSLSHARGRFWLVYTVVRTWGMGQPFKDLANYLVTAEKITGPWSDPIYLNGTGFDASLFHDEGGRQWVVSMEWDHRPGRPRFAGIVLQEYDHQRRALVGRPRTILKKNVLIEGPNLYRRGGWYYLMLAEGGTGWNHGISMARARRITGPYELDPQGSVLTARDDKQIELQKAGHGELVETPAGEWYLAHLASRPLGPHRQCVLGRETCLQRVGWSADGWLRLEDGGTRPQVEVAGPRGGTAQPWPVAAARDEFDRPKLDARWATLRGPADAGWLSLRARPGWLRLRGRESVHSLHDQSLVAQRLTAFTAVAETCLEFQPTDYTQSAGLICWYDTRMHYYLRVTHDAARGRVLGVALTDDGRYDELPGALDVNRWRRFFLRARIDGRRLQFSASPDRRRWRAVGPVLDASKLSDDYGQGLHFTGAFVGLCAQDLGGRRARADFDFFQLTAR